DAVRARAWRGGGARGKRGSCWGVRGCAAQTAGRPGDNRGRGEKRGVRGGSCAPGTPPGGPAHMRALGSGKKTKMARGIQTGLEEAGFVTDVSNTGFEGEDMAAGQQYDIIVLDLMLPDRDGIEICRNLRRRKVTTPLIMLTALGSTEDKVNGL